MDFLLDCNTISFCSHTDLCRAESTINALPKDITIFILNKLDPVSSDNFSKVCRHWLWIALAAKNEIPWFFSLFNGKLFRLELPPEVFDSRRYWSNWGWLIMECKKQGNHFLLNPMSRVLIDLSSTTTLPSLNYIQKAILLSPPPPAVVTANIKYSNLDDSNIGSFVETNDCIVMAIYKSLKSNFLSPQYLAFCRLGDEKWTAIESNHFWFEDIIFYNGKVYVINFQFDLILVEFRPSPKGTGCDISPPAKQFDSWELMAIYLVECLGELLVVLRCCTSMFKIFKLDPKGRCWIKVEDLGDQMIFNSTASTSFSRSELDYPGFRRNSIYFYSHEWECHKLFEFHLEDGSLSSFVPDYSCSISSPPIWFTSTSR